SRLFWNPSVTPVTMLATSVRVSPCSARCRGSSDGRRTTMCPSSTATCMSGCSVRESSPFAPLTRTVLPSIFTSTPAGSGIGCLPMRDTTATSLAPLPDVADDFAAHALLARFLVRHQAFGRGQPGDAEPAQYPRDLVPAGVDAPARLADALQPRNDPLLVGAVLEVQPHDALLAVIDDAVIADEAFLFQNARQLFLHVGSGHVH